MRQHASFQPCTQLFGSCLGFAVLKNNLSRLEGLAFTPPSSDTTKGDIYVPGTYTNIFFLIFRLMRYTYDFFFFTLGRSFYAWIDYSTTKWNRQTGQNQGRTVKSRAALYGDVRPWFRHLLLLLVDFLPHTWQFVVHLSFHLCYLYRSVQYRYLSTLYVCNLVHLINGTQQDDDVRGCTVVGEMMKKKWSSGAPVYVLQGNRGGDPSWMTSKAVFTVRPL